MLRLAPILPDSVMNYLLAITDVSPAVYVAATTVATVRLRLWQRGQLWQQCLTAPVLV